MFKNNEAHLIVLYSNTCCFGSFHLGDRFPWTSSTASLCIVQNMSERRWRKFLRLSRLWRGIRWMNTLYGKLNGIVIFLSVLWDRCVEILRSLQMRNQFHYRWLDMVGTWRSDKCQSRFGEMSLHHDAIFQHSLDIKKISRKTKCANFARKRYNKIKTIILKKLINANANFCKKNKCKCTKSK